jgi:F0F1-type ATP synthase assembly protein I
MAIVIGIVIGALVGWLIGKNKGLGGLGLILGGLLGVIGWIIVAVMKGNPELPNQPPQ